jgi:hypothetical protein
LNSIGSFLALTQKELASVKMLQNILPRIELSANISHLKLFLVNFMSAKIGANFSQNLANWF